MAIVRAPINGDTLRWARTVAHLSEDELGRAAGIPATRVVELENGIALPTYTQARRLARKLDRTPAFLFAAPPAVTDVPETADFRGRSHETPPTLTRELKRAEAHRRALLDLEPDVPTPPNLPRVQRQSLANSATSIRAALGVGASDIPPTVAGNPTFNYWRSMLEHHGFLVFQTTGIDLAVFRGLSVYHERLPLILLNGADSAGGKVFTLFHEVAHLANRTSGLCLLDEEVAHEALCNAFAAEFLMPQAAVMALLANGDTADPVDKVSTHFRVSRLAAAVKLKTLAVISAATLDDVRAKSDEEWQRSRARLRESESVPPRWRLRIRDLGPTYVSAVFRALESERVSLIDATYLLDARVPTIERMLAEYHRTGGAL